MNQSLHTRPYFTPMLATAFFLLAGCSGGNSSSPLAGSCNNVASGFCVEYTGADYKALQMQKVCESQKLTFLAGACPLEGRAGSCLVYKGEKSESIYRYYAGFPGFGVKSVDGVAAAAASQCTDLKGEWLAN